MEDLISAVANNDHTLHKLRLKKDETTVENVHRLAEALLHNGDTSTIGFTLILPVQWSFKVYMQIRSCSVIVAASHWLKFSQRSVLALALCPWAT